MSSKPGASAHPEGPGCILQVQQKFDLAGCMERARRLSHCLFFKKCFFPRAWARDGVLLPPGSPALPEDTMHANLLRALLALALAPAAGQAANITKTIVVNTPHDTTNVPGQCSLRDAFANVNVGGKTGTNSCAAAANTLTDETTLILFNSKPASPIVLSQSIQHLDNHALLRGMTIDGGGTTSILDVHFATTRLTLENVTFRNGYDPGYGAAITVDHGASLEAVGSAFRGNRSSLGGAIFVFDGGDILFRDTIFHANKSSHTAGAMDVQVADRLEIRNSRFSNNEAVHAAGALLSWNFPTLIVDTLFESNSTTLGEAGAADLSNATLERTHFLGNRAGAIGGGALFVNIGGDGVQISDSRFAANEAGSAQQSGFGGAVMAVGKLDVDSTTFFATGRVPTAAPSISARAISPRPRRFIR